MAAFACESCSAEVMVPTSCGRLEEPTNCAGCGKNWTMKLLHNRCLFLNRQLIKMQVGAHPHTRAQREASPPRGWV